MTTPHVPTPRAARGVASLSVLMLLLIAMLLVAAWAQRNVLLELRIAANQVHNAVAFEAAEAGLAWAQAMLNSGSPIGPDCRPGSAAGLPTFRSRYLGPADASGRVTARTASASTEPLRMLCARAATGWSCTCSDAASPSLTVSGDQKVPAFLVQFSNAARPGTVQVSATGCNHLAQPCLVGAADRADATSRLRITLAMLPALGTPPAATLTALGDVDAGAAALGLHNADALSGGHAAQTGGQLLGTALRIHTSPGSAAAAAVLAQDDALAALTPDQFFSRHFGIDMAQWMQQPGVQTLDCSSDCSAALRSAIAQTAEPARIGVRGNLVLQGGEPIGSATRPVVLVVDGSVQLIGPVQMHGLVHARSLHWDDAAEGTGALLHGALLLSQNYHGNAAPDMVYDPALMTRLRTQAGSWVRVPGSWRDF